MTEKIEELRNLLQPQAIAADISNKYTGWSNQRAQKEQEWKEVRNYLFATDTTTTSNKTLPWKNSTTTPYLTSVRDNLHANYMAALFSNPDWLKWESAAEEQAEKRESIEAYIKNKVEHSNFESEISKLVYDYIDYGNAFAEVISVKNEHQTEDGLSYGGYVGPKLVRTSPYDIVFDPTAPSFMDSPKIVRYVKSVGELENEIQTRPDLDYSQEAMERAKEMRTSISSFSEGDLDKAEGFTIDGFGSMRDYYSSGYVEILEFEGSVYDHDNGVFYKNHTITVMDRKFVLRSVENPSWSGKGLRAHVSWRERPDNLYGMGPLDNLVGMQYRLDHLENLKADAMDMSIHPPRAIYGDVESFDWGPDAEIHIPDGEGKVELLAPNPEVFKVDSEIEGISRRMEQMAGAPREAMGIRTPGEKTAFEVAQLQNAAGRIFQDKIGKFEKDFLMPILNMMLEVGRRQLENSKEIVKIVEPEFGLEEFITVTSDDILADGLLRPRGSLHFAARAQLVQNLQGIYDSGLGQKIDAHVSGIKLAKVIEEAFGWEKFGIIQENIAVIEQGDTQALANNVQMNNEADALTPVEEDEQPLV